MDGEWHAAGVTAYMMFEVAVHDIVAVHGLIQKRSFVVIL